MSSYKSSLLNILSNSLGYLFVFTWRASIYCWRYAPATCRIESNNFVNLIVGCNENYLVKLRKASFYVLQ